MVNPRIGAQLNLTKDHKKKEKTHLKAWPVPPCIIKGEASHSGHLFQHALDRRVKHEKLPTVSHYLNELMRITESETVRSKR